MNNDNCRFFSLDKIPFIINALMKYERRLHNIFLRQDHSVQEAQVDTTIVSRSANHARIVHQFFSDAGGDNVREMSFEDYQKKSSVWEPIIDFFQEGLERTIGDDYFGFHTFALKKSGNRVSDAFGSLIIDAPYHYDTDTSPNTTARQLQLNLANSEYIYPSTIFLGKYNSTHAAEGIGPVLILYCEKEASWVEADFQDITQYTNVIDLRPKKRAIYGFNAKIVAETLGIQAPSSVLMDSQYIVIPESCKKADCLSNTAHFFYTVLKSFQNETNRQGPIECIGMFYVPSGNDSISSTAILSPLRVTSKTKLDTICYELVIAAKIFGIIEKYLFAIENVQQERRANQRELQMMAELLHAKDLDHETLAKFLATAFQKNSTLKRYEDSICFLDFGIGKGRKKVGVLMAPGKKTEPGEDANGIGFDADNKISCTSPSLKGYSSALTVFLDVNQFSIGQHPDFRKRFLVGFECSKSGKWKCKSFKADDKENYYLVTPLDGKKVDKEYAGQNFHFLCAQRLEDDQNAIMGDRPSKNDDKDLDIHLAEFANSCIEKEIFDKDANSVKTIIAIPVQLQDEKQSQIAIYIGLSCTQDQITDEFLIELYNLAKIILGVVETEERGREEGEEEGRIEENAMIYHQFAKDIDALDNHLTEWREEVLQIAEKSKLPPKVVKVLKNIPELSPLGISQMVRYARQENKLIELPQKWSRKFFSRYFNWENDARSLFQDICDAAIKDQIRHSCKQALSDLSTLDPWTEKDRLKFKDRILRRLESGQFSCHVDISHYPDEDFFRLGLYPLTLYALRTAFHIQLLVHLLQNEKEKHDKISDKSVDLHVSIDFSLNDSEESVVTYSWPMTSVEHEAVAERFAQTKYVEEILDEQLRIFHECDDFVWKNAQVIQTESICQIIASY